MSLGTDDMALCYRRERKFRSAGDCQLLIFKSDQLREVYSMAATGEYISLVRRNRAPTA
jgi:hypothetical protein